MSERFVQIMNGIGVRDNRTGREYVYFTGEFIDFLNRCIGDDDE